MYIKFALSMKIHGLCQPLNRNPHVIGRVMFGGWIEIGLIPGIRATQVSTCFLPVSEMNDAMNHQMF
jgi:hypothetical protein